MTILAQPDPDLRALTQHAERWLKGRTDRLHKSKKRHFSQLMTIMQELLPRIVEASCQAGDDQNELNCRLAYAWDIVSTTQVILSASRRRKIERLSGEPNEEDRELDWQKHVADHTLWFRGDPLSAFRSGYLTDPYIEFDRRSWLRRSPSTLNAHG